MVPEEGRGAKAPRRGSLAAKVSVKDGNISN